MSFYAETTYSNTKQILLCDHKVAINVLVSDDGVVANSDGKKIVPAGTIVGGSTVPVLTNRGEPVAKKNTQGVDGSAAEGVLLYDVDVTHGANTGAMIIHGFVLLDRLPEAPCADAIAALKDITFVAEAKEVV